MRNFMENERKKEKMRRLTVYCYTLCAACLGCIVENSGAAGFWEAAGWTGALLASAVPVCLAGAFLAEHRPVKAGVAWYGLVAVLATGYGTLALLAFLATVSRWVAAGLLGGLLLCGGVLKLLAESEPRQGREGDP